MDEVGVEVGTAEVQLDQKEAAIRDLQANKANQTAQKDRNYV